MAWYTIAIPQWRLAKAREIELFDITVKSGDQRFAPEAKVLWAYKRGEVTDEEYTTLYRDKLTKLLHRDHTAFQGLFQVTEDKAVACYCRAGKFCHRHIWVDFVKEVADDNGETFIYLGEIV